MIDGVDREAAADEAWHDTASGHAVLGDDVAALRPLLITLAHPLADSGVGTGRLTASPGVRLGIDSSVPSLVGRLPHQVHDVDDAQRQFREVAAEQVGRGEGF